MEPPSDIARSWLAHLDHVVQNQNQITEQMRKNKEERDRLKREYNMMILKRESIVNDIASAAGMYGQLLCQPFCTKMCATLPRELRDRIYGYLLGPRETRPLSTCELNAKYDKVKFFDATYVGPQFAAEILEMAYTTDTTLLCSPFILPHSLSQSFGNVTCAECIRAIAVDIDLQDRFCRKACHSIPPAPSRRKPYKYEELKESLESLFFIKHKDGFELELRLRAATGWSKIKATLEAIKPIMMKLQDEGMQITIAYYQGQTKLNRYPSNLMRYYVGSWQDWKVTCREHRKILKANGVRIRALLPAPPLPPPPLPYGMPPPPPAVITVPGPPPGAFNSDSGLSWTEADSSMSDMTEYSEA